MKSNILDKYWEVVVNTISDGIMIVDQFGTIVSVNNAFEEITGYSSKELIGRTCDALYCNICKKARAGRKNHWCILFKTGSIGTRKCIIRAKNGKQIHALKDAALLRDDQNQIIGAVETITDISEVIEKDIQIEAFRRELREDNGFNGIIGMSSPMQQVYDLIVNAAQSDAPVIIYGESGTGKELVSRAIHENSNRKNKPFIKINCAALTESLLESELFGHVKGAFTGAYKGRAGRFEDANEGDIFLDEIGDLPLSTQVKLLRVLEEKVIERVGDGKPVPVDVRIITATNKDLHDLVESGEYREDFYFRINVIPIVLPPLRERKDDIPLLAESFFRKIRLKSGKNIQGVGKDTMKLLMQYNWPGNIRELKSVFEYVFVTCQDSIIRPFHLPPTFNGTNTSSSKKVFINSNQTSIPTNKDEQLKKELIDALTTAGGNQTKAAEMIGVSRITVWKRMKKFGIQSNQVIDY